MKLIQQWVATHLGLQGTVALGVLIALFTLWWNWEKVRKLPGIAWFFERRARRAQEALPPMPLPKPVPGRFSVAVAHLENDREGEQERLLVESLAEMGALQVLLFDRLIAPQNPTVEEAVKAASRPARCWPNRAPMC